DDESSAAWNVRGRALLALKRSEEALRAFQESVELDPENLHALNNLGYVWILHEDFQRARAYLDQAVVAAASQGAGVPAHVLNNLGVALERLGELGNAHEAYAQAMEAGHPTAGLALARVGSHLAHLPQRETRDTTLTAGGETTAIQDGAN
ncbi:MAG: tetratricopeptide repeat protein, partial [Candidatus Eisenbacteria bacterium]|nr:tetratricopeptide repeat protein [Candidatus Eisenbacteria bacterium]